MSAATSRHARPYNQLENLASEEAAKIARGMDTLPDPYAAERPLERTNRMSRSVEGLTSIYEVNGKIAPVTAIGQLNVTDPWGMAYGLESPFDASLAYSSNPAKMASRQSMYFGPNNSNPSVHTMPVGTTIPSPALSGVSSIESAQPAALWSEASSSSSGVSSSWQHDPPQMQTKRRSVSFQGDLAIMASGGRSSYDRSRSEFGSPSSERPASVRSRSAQGRTRSSQNLPSLLGNGRGTAAELPPIPVDPKILAKQQKRMSRAPGANSDAMSMMSGKTTDSRMSKRKSVFGWVSGKSPDPQNDPISAMIKASQGTSTRSKTPPVPNLPSTPVLRSVSSSPRATPLPSPGLATIPLPGGASPLAPATTPITSSPLAQSPVSSTTSLPKPTPSRKSSLAPPQPILRNNSTPMPSSASLAPIASITASTSSPAGLTVDQADNIDILTPPLTPRSDGHFTQVPASGSSGVSSIRAELVPLPDTPDHSRHGSTEKNPSPPGSAVPMQYPVRSSSYYSAESSPVTPAQPAPEVPAGPGPASLAMQTLEPVDEFRQLQVDPTLSLASPFSAEPQLLSPSLTVKPRASSSNLRTPSPEVPIGANEAQIRINADDGLPLPVSSFYGSQSSPNTSPAPTPKKGSKSPFAFFKRSRAKTLGERDQIAMKTETPPPVPTPQLSYSSSTNSTVTTNETSELGHLPTSPSNRSLASRPSVAPRKSSDGRFNTFSGMFGKRKNMTSQRPPLPSPSA